MKINVKQGDVFKVLKYSTKTVFTLIMIYYLEQPQWLNKYF